MECFVLLCHVGEGPIPTALVNIVIIYVTLITCYIKKIILLCTSPFYMFFMARRAIPMIAFPRVRCMFIYIYIFLCPLTRVCVVYVVKEVTSFQGARSINGRGA